MMAWQVLLKEAIDHVFIVKAFDSIIDGELINKP